MEQSIVDSIMPFASIVMSIVGLLISIVSIAISVYTAKKYGDVAGAIRIIEHEEQKATEARISALRSLLNEVERIRKLVNYNSDLKPGSSSKPAVRMPATAFETAFVSGESGLAVSPELLNAVTDYLTCADKINIFIDIFVAGVPSGEGTTKRRMNTALQEIDDLCTNILPGILDRLVDALQGELEAEITDSSTHRLSA